MISLFFLSSFLSFFLLAKQRGSIATAESEIIGAAWGEERLGIAWVSKRHNSEDQRVGVGMGCGLGRLNAAIGNEGMHRNY